MGRGYCREKQSASGLAGGSTCSCTGFLPIGCGSAESPPAPAPPSFVGLEDFEPDATSHFFLNTPGLQDKGTVLPTPSGQSLHGAHLSRTANPKDEDFFSHNHFGGQGSTYTGLAFWARSATAAPQTLIVAHVGLSSGLGYWDAQAAGAQMAEQHGDAHARLAGVHAFVRADDRELRQHIAPQRRRPEWVLPPLCLPARSKLRLLARRRVVRLRRFGALLGDVALAYKAAANALSCQRTYHLAQEPLRRRRSAKTNNGAPISHTSRGAVDVPILHAHPL